MLDDLDRVVDDVAREMTSGSVDAGFARRVSVRIDDAGADAEHPTRVWSRTWLLVPVTAGVAVLAVFLAREAQQSLSSRRPKPDATRNAQTNATPPAPSNGAANGSKVTAGVATVPSPKRVGTPRAAAFRPAMPRYSDVEPLATPPIEMAAIDVSPLLGVMPIEIAAIVIDRIEIAAMP